MAAQLERIRFRCRCGRKVSVDRTSPAAETRCCSRCATRHASLVRHQAVLANERRRSA